jgi:hypothetical protein
MNNSFARLIDGMCATLRTEVLTRLDDEFARGQVFGVINLLNTFKVRADWSAGFLLQQLEVQHGALLAAAATAQDAEEDREAGADAAPLPPAPLKGSYGATPISELLAARDAGNAAIGAWLAWIDAERSRLAPEVGERIEGLLRSAMRAEVDLELKNSPRPLFAEMSSGREG